MKINEIEGHEKCSKICKAICCGHVSIEIERPKTKENFDHIRWLLAHKNITIFVDSQNKWCLDFETPCEKITEKFDCSIYSERPKICKDYPPNGFLCEYDSTNDNELRQISFRTIEEFEEYLDKKGKQWRY